jgi:hypothetical protein
MGLYRARGVILQSLTIDSVGVQCLGFSVGLQSTDPGAMDRTDELCTMTLFPL